MKPTQLVTGAFALLAVMLYPMSIVQAAAICVPPPGSVAGTTGVPGWWSAPPASIGDPRWKGSVGIGHAGDNADFRGLLQEDGGINYLLLSWRVKADPGQAMPGDALYVGFWHEDSTIPSNEKGIIFKIARSSVTTTNPDVLRTLDLNDVSMRFRDASTAGQWNNSSASPPVPSWLHSFGRVDVVCNGHSPPTCDEWTIRLRIRLDPSGTTASNGASQPTNGVPVGTVFRMFWELDVQNGPLTAVYKWPTDVATVDESTSSYPVPTTWDQFQISTTPACRTAISFTDSQIYVTQEPPTGSPSEISVTGINVFHARPMNLTAGPLPRDAIKASFRIADWGSAIGDSPSWRSINSSCDDARDQPGTDVAIGRRWDLRCVWALSNNDRCAYDPIHFSDCNPMPSPRYATQAVFAELSNTGVPLLFANRSASHNMDFVHASEFRRRARIDINGLEPLGDGRRERDVYVYLQTRNMPKNVVDHEFSAQQLSLFNALGLEPYPINARSTAALQKLLADGTATLDQIEQLMPTYIVRVYHDTGIERNGTRIIEAQSSFGYFVSHDGPLNGWHHEIVGKDIDLRPIDGARNFYVTSVPEGGSIEVVTNIIAFDRRIGYALVLLFVGVASLSILGALLLRYLAKRSTRLR